MKGFASDLAACKPARLPLQPGLVAPRFSLGGGQILMSQVQMNTYVPQCTLGRSAFPSLPFLVGSGRPSEEKIQTKEIPALALCEMG